MKLRVFYATDGDCLLLTSSDKRHLLVDGGRGDSFETQTWPVLQALAKAKRPIDLVVVSHIDADHISGILWLMKVAAAWAVYDYQTTTGGNPAFPEPATTRPPAIGGLWHNSWRAQLGDLAEPIEAYLSRVGPGLQAAVVDRSTISAAALELIDAVEELAESIPQGIELLRVVDDETPIPRNKPFGKLVLLKNPPHVETLGKVELTVIGPARKHLETLREEWQEWLGGLAGSAPTGPPPQPGGPGLAADVGLPAAPGGPTEAQQLVASLEAAVKVIVVSDPSKVTPPNRASITLLAEEDDRTCLLTGDAAEEEILEGLDAAGRIVGGRFWCNVVKVQHHGSEHNLSQVFAGTVLADDYLLCGDGASGNPEASVVKTIIETRRKADPRPFRIWFNCSPERTRPNRRKALRAAIKEATKAAEKHAGITVNVLADAKDSFEITV
ncbi:MAG TPA: MBL fold metallo-hydrolase [Gaiellaceae bacterium]|nr:MBL fold metallo-hydrolase [Gaiellaceae bacterium]